MILGLKHFAIPVTSVSAAIGFYTKHLSFQSYHCSDSDWAMLRYRDTTISFVPVEYSSSSRNALDRKARVSAGVHEAHVGINVSSPQEVEKLRSRLSISGISVGEAKHHRDGTFGFYFKDPFENLIEVIFIPVTPKPLDEVSSDTAGILLAHGSSDQRWQQPFQALLVQMELNCPKVKWALSYMERAHPTFEESLTKLLAENKNIRKILVAPIFMANGGHLREDVPRLVRMGKDKYPGIQFDQLSAIGEDAYVQHAIMTSICEHIDRLDQK